MLLVKKIDNQPWNKSIKTCNDGIINIIENMPILSESKVARVLIKNNILHYSRCEVFMLERQFLAQSIKVLTSIHSSKNNISICQKCLSADYITSAASDSTDASDFNYRANFTDQVFKFAAIFEKSKEHSLKYNFRKSSEKLFQDLLQHQTLLNALPDDKFVDLGNIPHIEKDYLHTMVSEAIQLCSKTEEFLKDEKISEIIQKEFLKLAGEPASAVKNEKIVLYGFFKPYQRPNKRYFSDKKLDAHQKVLYEYYKLIELAIFNQKPTQESYNFAIIMPAKAANEFFKNYTKYNYSQIAYAKINMLTNLKEKAKFLNNTTLQLAYLLWKANNYAENTYEAALKAAFIAQY